MELNGRKSTKLRKKISCTSEKFVQEYSKLSNNLSSVYLGAVFFFEEFLITFSDRSIFLLQPFLHIEKGFQLILIPRPNPQLSKEIYKPLFWEGCCRDRVGASRRSTRKTVCELHLLIFTLVLGM